MNTIFYKDLTFSESQRQQAAQGLRIIFKTLADESRISSGTKKEMDDLLDKTMVDINDLLLEKVTESGGSYQVEYEYQGNIARVHVTREK